MTDRTQATLIHPETRQWIQFVVDGENAWVSCGTQVLDTSRDQARTYFHRYLAKGFRNKSNRMRFCFPVQPSTKPWAVTPGSPRFTLPSDFEYGLTDT